MPLGPKYTQHTYIEPSMQGLDLGSCPWFGISADRFELCVWVAGLKAFARNPKLKTLKPYHVINYSGIMLNNTRLPPKSSCLKPLPALLAPRTLNPRLRSPKP